MTTRRLIIALIVLLTAMGCSPSQPANTPSAQTLTIESAWVRASSTAVTAAYVTLINTSNSDETLGTVTADGYTIEVHETVVENDIAKMQPIETLVVPANGRVEMTTGGIHLMIMDGAPLEDGQTLKLIFEFQSGKIIEVDAPIKFDDSEEPHDSHGD